MYTYQRPEDIKIYRYLTLDAVNAALAKLKAEKGIVLEAQATVGTAGNFVTENNGVMTLITNWWSASCQKICQQLSF